MQFLFSKHKDKCSAALQNGGLIERIKHFSREIKAATAVEFGMLLFPFTLIVIGMLEVSYDYYLQQVLDIDVYKISNAIRYGTAQSNSGVTDAGTFWTNYVVPNMSSDFNTSYLQVDVIQVTAATQQPGGLTFTNGDSVTITANDTTTSLPNRSVTNPSIYNPGSSGTLNVLQAAYLHPNITPLMNLYFMSTATVGGTVLTGAKLTSTVVFKHE